MGLKLVCHLNGRTQVEGLDSRALWRVFALQRDEVTGGCIKLLMKEFMMCTVPNVSLLISRKVKLMGLAACM